MVLYQFKCKNCGDEFDEMFPAADYDKKVAKNGRLKRRKCKKCNTLSIYRHIINMPGVLGGTKGYVSMERWQSKNPDHAKRKEEQLEKKLAGRHRKRVLDKINKQMGGDRREERHKGYGDGQSEEKLKSDDA